jgi:hypothetical protein
MGRGRHPVAITYGGGRHDERGAHGASLEDHGVRNPTDFGQQPERAPQTELA